MLMPMPFGSLWLPVLVATAAVFVASSIVHMALKYHKSDYRGLAQEDAVAEAIRKAAPGPGLYFLPYCADMKTMKEPAMQAKFEKGPVALLTVRPSGKPNLGGHLLQWLGFCFLVSFSTAYVARHTLHAGQDAMTVLRITGAVSFLAYGMGEISDGIWKGQPWANSLRSLFDALIYALVTGGAFRLLWPSA